VGKTIQPGSIPGDTEGNWVGGREAPRFAVETWNKKFVDISEGRPITNNTCKGFNSGWNGTMNKGATLFVVLKSYLNKLSRFSSFSWTIPWR
jgi:hypothetical protein